MKRLTLLFSILGLLCSCGGTPTPPAISVSLAPATQTTIDQGQTLKFTATVANDSSRKGVTWSVSGTGCTRSACGTFTNTAATTATYNAPSPVASNLTVSVMATSVADATKSASSTVVVTPPPSIATTSLSDGTVGIAYSATLAATGGAGTLIWSLATGSSLPAGLSLSNSGAISGTPTLPGPSTFTVEVTDSSGAQEGVLSAQQELSFTIQIPATCGCGNESVLNGQYAFKLSGFNGTGYLAVVGSFTGDGTGKIITGEVDSNGALGVQHANVDTTASWYSLGADNRGCATIATSFGTFTTHLAAGSLSSGVATKGRLIEWENPSSAAYIAAGQIRLQDPNSFASGLSGNYVFRTAGVDVNVPPARTVSVGVLTAADGSFSNGEQDMNVLGGGGGGNIYHITDMTGTYTTAGPNGRFTGTLVMPSFGTFHLAFYLVSGSEVFAITTDTAGTTAVLSCEMREQVGTFDNSAFNGKMVLYASGGISSAVGGGTIMTADGNGSVDFFGYPFSYTVAANGRTLLTITGGSTEFLYLSSANTGFLINNDWERILGEFEPQAAGPFDSSTLSGTFFLGTDAVVRQSVSTDVGSATLDGIDGITTVTDLSSNSSQVPGSSFTDTYTVHSDGTITLGSSGSTVDGIVVSDSKLVLIGHPTSESTVLVVEK